MITKEKILEILEKNSILSRTAGRFVIYENDWENIAQEIVKNCSIQRVSQRSELYFAFMEEYNALMGESEHQILKEEVVVLLAKYSG